MQHAIRNAVLIAIAFDATEAEVQNAHDIIDSIYSNGAGAVDPAYLVNAAVSGTANGQTANGQQVAGTANGQTANTLIDSTGLPWDARIHSSNQKKTGDGKWWGRRGVQDSERVRIENELRAQVAGNAIATHTPPPAAAGTTTTPPSLPAPGGAPNLPLPGAATIDPAYQSFVQFIAANTNSAANPAGRLNDEWVSQVLNAYGVANGSVQNLAHAPHLIPQVRQYIEGALAGAQ